MSYRGRGRGRGQKSGDAGKPSTMDRAQTQNVGRTPDWAKWIHKETGEESADVDPDDARPPTWEPSIDLDPRTSKKPAYHNFYGMNKYTNCQLSASACSSAHGGGGGLACTERTASALIRCSISSCSVALPPFASRRLLSPTHPSHIH